MIRVTYRKKTTPVDPEADPVQGDALDFIWESSGLQVEQDAAGHPLKWRNLGFESEDIVHEFHEVGVLGLECLVSPFLLAVETH